MPSLPALDLTELLKDIPRGAWVAISEDSHEVVTYGSDLRDVLRRAKDLGEEEPLILRVPETATTLAL